MTNGSPSKLSRLKIKMGEWVGMALQGTPNHFSCYLPSNIGKLPSLMLKLFYSGIKVKRESVRIIKGIPKDAVIVYATKYKSYFQYLFYHTRYRQMRLPCPEIGFDYNVFLWQPVSRIFRILVARIDALYRERALPNPYDSMYIKGELTSGRTALLSLVEKKGFHRRFVRSKPDPIQYLIELQKSIDVPVYIVPQLMLFSTKPYRATPTLVDILLGIKENPGSIRKLMTLFKNPGKVFVEIAEPLNLKEFLEMKEDLELSIPHLAVDLRRHLLVQINRHRQSIIGPVLKSSEEFKESILTNPRLQEFMDHYSKKRKIPKYKAYKQADAHLDEIAAKYNIGIIRVGATLFKWALNSMFEGVTVNHDLFERLKSMTQKGTLILVPCHKSHIDYLILSYVLYNNNMACPHIAAGKNLSFWPIGPLFRGAGAFFIRRSFRGAVLYSRIFSEYIQKLLSEGFNIEFFIEGGRSRTGKLIVPKLGLLSILLTAFRNGACQDMIFVPIYIGYDRVLEEGAYLHEIEGGQKKPESFMQVIKARKLLKKRYGRIYIQFHEPLSLNEILAQNETPLQEMTSKEQNALSRNLGHRIINAINKVTVVTPHGLVASALLNCKKRSFSYDHLKVDVETYLTHLYSQNTTLADTLLLDPEHAIKNAFKSYVQRKVIEQISKDKGGESSEALYQLNEAKRQLLEYYKNNCVAFFIPAAFTALLIIEKDAFQFSASDLHAGYAFLQEFFKNEFAYDVDRTPEHYVRKAIKSFIDEAVLMPHPAIPDSYNLTSAGFRKIKLFSSFLKTYFESYWVVLNFFMQNPKESINRKDRLKKIQALGSRMYKQDQIERKESLSKIYYTNAVDYFIAHRVKGSEDEEKIDYYAAAIRKYLNQMP